MLIFENHSGLQLTTPASETCFSDRQSCKRLDKRQGVREHLEVFQHFTYFSCLLKTHKELRRLCISYGNKLNKDYQKEPNVILNKEECLNSHYVQ